MNRTSQISGMLVVARWSCVCALSLLCSAAPAAAAPTLPEGRVYEQVTPADKNGGDVGGPALSGLFASARGQSSTDGDAIAYVSLSAFGDVQSGELVTQYVSTRGTEGWSTHAISPANPTPGARGINLSPFQFFTPDLSTAVLDWREPALTAGAPAGFDSLYLRGSDGSYRLISDVTPAHVEPESYVVTFAGATPDASRVIFEANDALTAGAPPSARSVYEWEGDALRLVSVLPGGAAAASAGAGDGWDDDFADVISTDGSRIFWTDSEGQLYVREDAARTAKLNSSARSPSLGDGTATLRAITPDGSRAIFTDPTPLTGQAGDMGGGIYEYDLASRGLRDLTPYPGGDPEVQGVLGMSADGSTVYFVAGAALAPGAVSGAENLYVARGLAVEFIAALSGADWADWTQSYQERSARVSPDGTGAIFLSQESLTGYDNADALTGNPDVELFDYEQAHHDLLCLSCNPSGARPIGSASLPTGTDPGYEPRVWDGGAVFFDSADALVPADSNGRQDVYEYREGTVALVSSGTSADISALVDTSAEARDVFFTTRASLVAGDRDNGSDIYDARIGGGFPVPPEGALPCSGEACRGPLTEPPAPVAPATLSAATSEAAVAGLPHKSKVRCASPRSRGVGQAKRLDNGQLSAERPRAKPPGLRAKRRARSRRRGAGKSKPRVCAPRIAHKKGRA